LAAVLIASVGLSACGRKGALQPPPKAAITEDQAATDGSQPPGNDGPNRKFPLDFLL